jgi:predicted dehydrogenase
MTEPSPIRVAVVGVGHMGRYHVAKYAAMDGARLVAVVDADEKRAAEAAAEFGCDALGDPAALLGRVDAVSVAVPTVAHGEVACPLLAAGVPALIEKPLAQTVEEGRRLLAAAAAGGTFIQVGHTERFNPVVTAIDRYGIAPRYVECHRVSPFTFRSADVGVVLDVMIHDIDIVLHLVGSPVTDVRAVGVSVIGPSEDLANVRLQFANGCVANLTASRMAFRTDRRVRLFSRQAYLSLDYQKRYGIIVRKSPELDLLKLAAEHKDLRTLADVKKVSFGDLVKVEEIQIDEVDALERELAAFLHSVRSGTPPVVSGEEGLAAVELATRIVEAIRAQPGLEPPA